MDSIKTRLGKIVLQQQLNEVPIILFRFAEYPDIHLCLMDGAIITREATLGVCSNLFRIPMPPFSTGYVINAHQKFEAWKIELLNIDPSLTDIFSHKPGQNFSFMWVDEFVSTLSNRWTEYEVLGLFLDSNEKVI